MSIFSVVETMLRQERAGLEGESWWKARRLNGQSDSSDEIGLMPVRDDYDFKRKRVDEGFGSPSHEFARSVD